MEGAIVLLLCCYCWWCWWHCASGILLGTLMGYTVLKGAYLTIAAQ